MDFLLPLAAKSLLIAGAALLMLQLMRNRSASDRSLIAHLGLGAILILPLAWLALPQLEVATPWVEPEPLVVPAPMPDVVIDKEAGPAAATFPEAAEPSLLASIDWAFWGYAFPAVILLFLTLIALGRLVVLKARANVLVEPNWLTALAHAQRRMGFKHGTALLTSDELSSPISWGLMRPVILLNSEAAEAHKEAEAIIAHELAHVARLDWLKLLLSRVTIALFWFNPLVWLLAREAHQLREEAADDAVLASNIEDTEYARLLVGIARHECRGLLLGAHGVAPARNSLARRVKRVLDGALARAPGGWRWTAAMGFFAAGMAVPLALLQFVPTTPAGAASVATVGGKKDPAKEAAKAAEALAAAGVTMTVDGDKAVMSVRNGDQVVHYTADADPDFDLDFDVDPHIDVDHDPDIDETVARAVASARGDHSTAVGRAVSARAVGVTPGYIASMKKAMPGARLEHGELVGLASLGVSPAYIRELASAGYRKLSAAELAQAKALHISGDYARTMNAIGHGRLSMVQLTQLKAVGVGPDDVQEFRKAGRKVPSVDQLVQMKALGLDAHDLDETDGP